MPPIDIPHVDAVARSEWRILDVGCGNHPYRRANVCVDSATDQKRALVEHGVGVWHDFGLGQEFVKADVCDRLPFGDGEFDLAICRNVLEHVEDPEAACRELSRVARLKYIETPSVAAEMIFNTGFHKWLVALCDGVLVFRPKPKTAFWTAPFEFCGERIHADDKWWGHVTAPLREHLEWAGQCRVWLLREGEVVGRVEADDA